MVTLKYQRQGNWHPMTNNDFTVFVNSDQRNRNVSVAHLFRFFSLLLSYYVSLRSEFRVVLS